MNRINTNKRAGKLAIFLFFTFLSLTTIAQNKDKKITVAISDGETISYGIISSYNKYKNELVVSELTTDIKYNDELNVITTNFTNSFKEGIIIGKVKKIEDDTNGLSKNAIITPILNYNDIKYVCVVGVK